jgi:hypothetical protein
MSGYTRHRIECSSVLQLSWKEASFLRIWPHPMNKASIVMCTKTWTFHHRWIQNNIGRMDFIGLSPYTLPDFKDRHVGHYQPMANETKKYLQDLYRPHNRKLHELLAPHGIEISWAKEA